MQIVWIMVRLDVRVTEVEWSEGLRESESEWWCSWECRWCYYWLAWLQYLVIFSEPTIRSVFSAVVHLFLHSPCTIQHWWALFNVSRNRFPLVGIYKETKNKSKKRSTNQVHAKSKGLSRHPTATTSVLPRLSLGSFVEKISAACPTCNISQQVSDLTLTIGQEEQQPTKNCLVATAELHQIIVEYWSWRLEQAPEFATMCGVHKFDDRLSSYSLDAIEQRVEQCKVFLERLNRINVRKLSKDDRLNLKLIKVRLLQMYLLS